jgi:hypothetical protein
VSIVIILIISTIVFTFTIIFGNTSHRRSGGVAESESANDTNGTEDTADDNTSPGYAAFRMNSKGFVILSSNSAVSMRELNLSAEVPCKSRDPDGLKIFNASLTFSKSFGVFSYPLR